MDNIHPDGITAFDALFTTNHIRMMKILLGYISPPLQGKLAVYIKFLELRHTLSFFRQNPSAALSFCPSGNGAPKDLAALLDEILPFCSKEEDQRLREVKNMMQNMKNMQEMMDTMQMLRELSPELFSQDGADMSQMMEMMQGMFQS